jgi:hypothetical protein
LTNKFAAGSTASQVVSRAGPVAQRFAWEQSQRCTRISTNLSPTLLPSKGG